MNRVFRCAVALPLVLAALVSSAHGDVPSPPAYGHAAIDTRDGRSVFAVDGKPFFLYGAAFFYERLPRDAWPLAMRRLRDLGINTLDLYVPWNWHEVADGDFDFDGHTNPRRDLRYVLRLAKQFDFEIVLRPGPVVRNEWRNGGYPAWLLSRPEYGMPVHDLLEGRYPPLATLQNLHSDDAAAGWLHNATHMRYARRWLERVLTEFRPVADRVVAVALDDDQGAYIDNQTYPAPSLAAYLLWLRGVVHGVTGPAEPVFINTYQMKVPASSPVWVMGNWYQSDAYALGDHDRTQLTFSTALLGTRPRQPQMASEFQAGWLQGPGAARPRPADPSNTLLAMTTMVGLGVRGIVNFPAQDTFYPAGWEVPFANAFYAWDAALGIDAAGSPRAAPTAEIGALVTLLGPQLAASAQRYDAAIAYLGAAAGPGVSNAYFAQVAARTMAAQEACRRAGLTCALVDPAAESAAALARYPALVVPRAGSGAPFVPAIAARLRDYARRGGRLSLVAGDPAAVFGALRRARRPIVEGVPGGAFARDTTGALDGFLSVANYARTPLDVSHATVEIAPGDRIVLPHFVVPAHGALIAPLGLRLAVLDARFRAGDVLSFTDCMPVGARIAGGALEFANEADLGASVTSATRACRLHVRLHGTSYDVPAGSGVAPGERIAAGGISYLKSGFASAAPAAMAAGFVPLRSDAHLPAAPFAPVPPGEALATRADVFRDGEGAVVLDNGLVRVVVAPGAGARAFVFEDDLTRRNAFTTVGALRDDVAVEPSPSPVDKIAKYTHDFPAGTFNRAYAADIVASGRHAVARFTYDAPDVVPNGASFTRKLTLEPNARAFVVDEGVDFHRSDPIAQRAVSVSSLSVGEPGTAKTRFVLTPRAAPASAGAVAHVESGNALGYYDAGTRELATVAWRAGDVEEAALSQRASSVVVRLTLAPGGAARVRYGYRSAATLAEARAALDEADGAMQEATQGAFAPGRTKTLAGKWRNGLRDRLKSD